MYTPFDWLEKWTWRRVVLSISNEILITKASNIVLFGHWHVSFLWHGFKPNHIVRKRCLSTFYGTFAVNFALFKLLIFLVKLVTNIVSLKIGSFGLKKGSFFFFRFSLSWLMEYSIWEFQRWLNVAGPVPLSWAVMEVLS